MSSLKNQLNLSKYYVCLATNEDKLLSCLENINENLLEKNRFNIVITGLHTGDVMLGRVDKDFDDVEDIQENFITHKIPNFQPLLLDERKTIGDYCKSFKSEHFKNQKTRMMSLREKTNIQCFLVVEGYYEEKIDAILNSYNGVPFKTLEQCFTSIRIRDKFFVKHVKDTNEHAEFLYKCLSTIERYKIFREEYANSTNLNKDYAESLKIKKKNNMTPELCYKIQLSTIPGISISFAEYITNVYPNMQILLETLKTNGKLALSEIMVGKNRLGKIKSERIYNYLLMN